MRYVFVVLITFSSTCSASFSSILNCCLNDRDLDWFDTIQFNCILSSNWIGHHVKLLLLFSIFFIIQSCSTDKLLPIFSLKKYSWCVLFSYLFQQELINTGIFTIGYAITTLFQLVNSIDAHFHSKASNITAGVSLFSYFFTQSLYPLVIKGQQIWDIHSINKSNINDTLFLSFSSIFCALILAELIFVRVRTYRSLVYSIQSHMPHQLISCIWNTKEAPHNKWRDEKLRCTTRTRLYYILYSIHYNIYIISLSVALLIINIEKKNQNSIKFRQRFCFFFNIFYFPVHLQLRFWKRKKNISNNNFIIKTIIILNIMIKKIID